MLSRDLIGTLLFLTVFTGYGVFAWQIPMLPFEEYEVVTSSTMPKIYAVLGVLVCLFSLIGCLLKQKGINQTALEENPLNENVAQTLENKVHETPVNNVGHWCGLHIGAVIKTLYLLALMAIYAMSLESLGFIVSTFLFLSIGFFTMGERRLKVLLLASVPVVLLFWVLMTQVLGIYLAAGSLWS